MSWFSAIEIYTTETDSISTAVRDKNATIEKLYNCVIEVNSSESPGSLVNAEVTSGKQTIDMYSYFMSGEGAATSGNNYNLYSLGIDFSNSWWDQNYVNSYTIKNSSGTKTSRSKERRTSRRSRINKLRIFSGRIITRLNTAQTF